MSKRSPKAPDTKKRNGSIPKAKARSAGGSRNNGKEARTVVFVGPSISGREVLGLLPNADVRRPIRRGDLDTLPPDTVVAIIDGVFDAEHAVSPREIRMALRRGVRIIGSSSMGALRACEVPQMVGVGKIYEMYRDGQLRRDDEVAILLDNETGRALTEPLVNIRYAVERLVSSGSLSAEHGKAIVDAGIALHFHDRTYRNVIRKAGLAGAADVDTLLGALKSVDLKREDARTLLEGIDEFKNDPRWTQTLSEADPENEHPDELARVRPKRVVRADAPLFLWEWGESLDFRSLLRFIALTGQLDGHLRRAIVRFLLDDGSVPRPEKLPEVPEAQDILDQICERWGWGSTEELRVTLRDLGVGRKHLTSEVFAEREAQLRLASLVEKMPKALLHALRFELLTNDVALKREAMRFGALLTLAKGAEGTPNTEECDDAKRALLGAAAQYTWVHSWEEFLSRQRLSEQDSREIVHLIALARRRGVPLLERYEKTSSALGNGGAGVANLPIANFAEGAKRSVADREGAELAQRIGKIIGVTRVAQLSELERIGHLHVTSAYRPSPWSSTVGSGKSENLEGAIVGAIMEEFEKYCQESFETDVEVTRAFREWDRSEAVVDPIDLALPYDSRHSPDRPISWTWMRDLVSGTNVHVPTSALVAKRLTNDPFFCARRGQKCFGTNGLASGFTITEALVHAVSERIERHALKLAEQAISNPGRLPGEPPQPFPFVDLRTCPPSTQRICESLKKGGFEVRAMDITCEIKVPTFFIAVLRAAPLFGLEQFAVGHCTDPNPEVALNRAILEGVQTRLTALSGAREDLTVKARSLGRHERPRPGSLGYSIWWRPWVRKQSFEATRGFIGTNARDGLSFLVKQLTAASYDRVLYRDISREETKPAAAVRVLIPRTEDMNPFHTGERARVQAVSDLMRRHEW